jgi:hypothetical protein
LKPRFNKPLSPMDTFKKNLIFIYINCIFTVLMTFISNYSRYKLSPGKHIELIVFDFSLFIFATYFSLCLSARMIHVMLGTNPEHGFFYYGRLLIKDFVKFFLIYILIMLLFIAISFCCINIIEKLRIINFSPWYDTLPYIISFGAFLGLIITAYMSPMYLFKRIYRHETTDISIKWILEGPVFLFKNLKVSLPIIGLYSFVSLGSILSVLFKNQYIILCAISAFLGLPLILGCTMALFNLLVFGFPDMFEKNQSE